MSSLRIAAAQSVSAAGDVSANVATHCRFIAHAAAQGVDVLVFPELSLCGYELPLLRACALQPEADVLSPIRELSVAKAITVVVGAPVVSDSERVHIGAITFLPDGHASVYLKQYLHPGEERFAFAGEVGTRAHGVGSDAFALAICADITHEQHARAASAAGATCYLASVFVTEAGYATDSSLLQGYAARHGMATLMANHGGPSGEYVSAGKSAFWSPEGTLVIAAPGIGSCLVIASRSTGGWSGKLLTVENEALASTGRSSQD